MTFKFSNLLFFLYVTSPRHLIPEEFAFIKRHPELGFNILKDLPLSDVLKNVVYQHHEKLDGSGYPNQLKADQISIGAQIVAVADIYEAISSHRPYRPGIESSIAIDEIEDQAGITLNKEAVAACVKILKSSFEFPKFHGIFF